MGSAESAPRAGRGFRLDVGLSLCAAVWLAAADALLMVNRVYVPAGEHILGPFGKLSLSPAGYVLLLLLVCGAVIGVILAALQRFWVRAPLPWRPTISALLALNFLTVILGGFRLRAFEAEVMGRYFRGLGLAFVVFALAAISIPALHRKQPDASSWHGAGRAAAGLTLILCLGMLGGPLIQGIFLARAPRPGRPNRRPNIIILLLDAVRADALSCLNPAGGRSPRIDAIAREGALFRRAVAPSPWTVPSHASLFTGLYPSQHGALWENRTLDQGFHTLAEILYESGYRTVGFSENPNISKAAGFGQGFEEFSELFLDPQRAIVPQLLDTAWGRAFHQPPTYEYTKESVSQLVRWLRRNALDEDAPPFFAFLNLMAGHLPNYARREFDSAHPSRETVERLAPINLVPQRFYLPAFKLQPDDLDVLRMFYEGDITYLDSWLGRLFDFLRRKSLLDDTFLVIVADHGENFGEHGLIEHAFCLYNTLLHIPLIIRYPPKVPAGLVRQDAVSMVRLFDTLVDLSGEEGRAAAGGAVRHSLLDRLGEPEVYAESENLAGTLKPVLAGEPGAAALDTRPFDKSLKCLYAGDYKLIESSDGRLELYNTTADWAEAKDLSAAQRERTQILRQRLSQWEKKLVRPSFPRTPPRVGRDVKEALKALGYIH